MKSPDVYIGTAEEIKWAPEDEPDDDTLESTPKAVVQILGFDPMEDDT